ncbi:MAG: hypothetical protein QG622_2303 [Actinomycetota bacterium]|nr:hypothetical protein [Actinomycetota bacterium]
MKKSHLALLTVGVIVVVGIGILMFRGGGTAQADGTSAPGSAAGSSPAPIDQSGVHLVFTSPEVASGEVLTFTVKNPTDTVFEYGAAADLTRWDGKDWKPSHKVALGWGDKGVGRLAPLKENLAVPLIALMAPAGGNGQALSVKLTDLPAGRYRMSVEPGGGQPPAQGIFGVR